MTTRPAVLSWALTWPWSFLHQMAMMIAVYSRRALAAWAQTETHSSSQGRLWFPLFSAPVSPSLWSVNCGPCSARSRGCDGWMCAVQGPRRASGPRSGVGLRRLSRSAAPTSWGRGFWLWSVLSAVGGRGWFMLAGSLLRCPPEAGTTSHCSLN